MKKYILDLRVSQNVCLSADCSLLKVTFEENILPPMKAGQFVQIAVNDSKTTYLRRPISICYVDRTSNELWLLIRKAGAGTDALIHSEIDDKINMILPLGNGFTIPEDSNKKALLVGGGVGVAPLLYLGNDLKNRGIDVTFLLGAKSRNDLLLLDEFKAISTVVLSTDDGSYGESGLVTNNSILNNEKFDLIYCCGPLPMMKSVAKIAKEKGIECEVSLENTMACGIGACLCCVEDTKDEGNVCVCKDGPVFNINRLKW